MSEVGYELITFVALDFTRSVLASHGELEASGEWLYLIILPAPTIVKFHGLVCRCAGLILSGILAKPEVEIIGE